MPDTPVVHNIPTIADRIRASDENDTPISGLNLRTIASAIRHKDSTTGTTIANALNSGESAGFSEFNPSEITPKEPGEEPGNEVK